MLGLDYEGRFSRCPGEVYMVSVLENSTVSLTKDFCGLYDEIQEE
jgi:hypothetical protein